jgi:hypothetical protein
VINNRVWFEVYFGAEKQKDPLKRLSGNFEWGCFISDGKIEDLEWGVKGSFEPPGKYMSACFTLEKKANGYLFPGTWSLSYLTEPFKVTSYGYFWPPVLHQPDCLAYFYRLDKVQGRNSTKTFGCQLEFGVFTKGDVPDASLGTGY